MTGVRQRVRTLPMRITQLHVTSCPCASHARSDPVVYLPAGMLISRRDSTALASRTIDKNTGTEAAVARMCRAGPILPALNQHLKLTHLSSYCTHSLTWPSTVNSGPSYMSMTTAQQHLYPISDAHAQGKEKICKKADITRVFTIK